MNAQPRCEFRVNPAFVPTLPASFSQEGGTGA
jgi:hypothetical protein